MRKMINKDKKDGKYFKNEKIKEMNRKVSDEVELVNKKKKNKRYGYYNIGDNEKDIYNVVNDDDYGVVDIFNGIDKDVEDNWKNLWKEGKDDGIGYNLYRK